MLTLDPPAVIRALPSEDLGRDGETGEPADADVANPSQRTAGSLLRRRSVAALGNEASKLKT